MLSFFKIQNKSESTEDKLIDHQVFLQSMLSSMQNIMKNIGQSADAPYEPLDEKASQIERWGENFEVNGTLFKDLTGDSNSQGKNTRLIALGEMIKTTLLTTDDAGLENFGVVQIDTKRTSKITIPCAKKEDFSLNSTGPINTEGLQQADNYKNKDYQAVYESQVRMLPLQVMPLLSSFCRDEATVEEMVAEACETLYPLKKTIVNIEKSGGKTIDLNKLIVKEIVLKKGADKDSEEETQITEKVEKYMAQKLAIEEIANAAFLHARNLTSKKEESLISDDMQEKFQSEAEKILANHPEQKETILQMISAKNDYQTILGKFYENEQPNAERPVKGKLNGILQAISKKLIETKKASSASLPGFKLLGWFPPKWKNGTKNKQKMMEPMEKRASKASSDPRADQIPAMQ